MSWKHKQPDRDDYDSLEEYEDALDRYEQAEADYIDEYLEKSRGI